MITEDFHIKSWIYAAHSAVDRALAVGEASRAITLLDLISRLERDLAAKAKKDTVKPAPLPAPEPLIKEEVPF